MGKDLKHQVIENRLIVFELYRRAYGDRALKYAESLRGDSSLVIVSRIDYK